MMLASRFVLQMFTWLTTLLVIRFLDPSDYGLIAATMMVVTFAHLITDGGLIRALIQKPDATEHDQRVAFTTSAAVCLAVVTLIWLLSGALSVLLGSPKISLLLRVMSLYLVMQIFLMVPEAKLERSLQYGKLALAGTTSAVVQAAVTLALAWLEWGVWALASGILAGRLAYLIGLNIMAPWRPAMALPKQGDRALLRFGMTVAGTNLLWFLHHNSDTAVISSLLGPAQLGLYAVAMQLAVLPLEKFNVTINSVSFATFSRLQGDQERLQRWFLKLLTLRCIAAFPVLIGLALIADDFLPLLLGDKWRQMVPLFQVLAPVGALMVVSTSFTPLFNAIGRPDLALKYTAVSALSMPVAFLVGCKLGGLMGVCLAWLALYPPLLVGMVILSQRASGVRALGVLKALLAPAVGAIVMTIIVIAAETQLTEDVNVFLRIGVVIVLGAFAYSASIAALSWSSLKADISALRTMMAEGKDQSKPAPT